jgi:NitT/TauT family transport system substrate-binding protein
MTRLRCLAKTAQLAAFVALSVFSTLAGAADKVTFVTDYGLYGHHAYYFVAMEKGYYARENLDIEIVRSQGSANTIKQVANGTAQVGFADAFAVVLGRANDDIPVKLVAMIYPKPPHAVYVLKESESRGRKTSRVRRWPTPHSVRFPSSLQPTPKRQASMPER